MEAAQHNKNMEKYHNYRELFPRLDLAVENSFYLEAVFIAYAIVEDRTESVLRHLGIWEKALGDREFLSISRKIRLIRRQAHKPGSPAAVFVSDDLLDQFEAWANARNTRIHHLMEHPFSNESLKDLAEEGKKLARTISNRTEATKRALEKAKQP